MPRSPVCVEQQAEVERVLQEIGAGDVPQILVFNKLDQLPSAQRPRRRIDARATSAHGRRVTARVRQRTGDGYAACPRLRAASSPSGPCPRRKPVAPQASRSPIRSPTALSLATILKKLRDAMNNSRQRGPPGPRRAVA
jgi:hypothetical protein